ncbi:hypothetical protein [Streptomyces sp. NPDC006552]|uniref:hypothetical protein n=1 Tax=Streptomyces sp. NPDC006552 TaxID=3157179 RepID=UPI0033BD3BED
MEILTDLLGRAEGLIDRLGKDAPLEALRAARHMEVVAQRLGDWPAHDVRRDMSVEQAAAGLGLDTRHTRALMVRMGDWSPRATCPMSGGR